MTSTALLTLVALNASAISLGHADFATRTAAELADEHEADDALLADLRGTPQPATMVPTFSPSVTPSRTPTLIPSTPLTSVPTARPSTQSPTYKCPPTVPPSRTPTDRPSFQPSFQPTPRPSFHPTVVPSALPSATPTERPTTRPPTPATLTSKKDGGAACHFPFVYKGTSYSQCTTKGYTVPWCYTGSSTGPLWGECIVSTSQTKPPTTWPTAVPTKVPSMTPTFAPSTQLPTHVPSVGTTRTPSSIGVRLTLTKDGNARGAPCHFPFVYKAQTYGECTTNGHQKPWCYTGSSTGPAWGECIIKRAKGKPQPSSATPTSQVSRRSVLKKCCWPFAPFDYCDLICDKGERIQVEYAQLGRSDRTTCSPTSNNYPYGVNENPYRKNPDEYFEVRDVKPGCANVGIKNFSVSTNQDVKVWGSSNSHMNRFHGVYKKLDITHQGRAVYRSASGSFLFFGRWVGKGYWVINDVLSTKPTHRVFAWRGPTEGATPDFNHHESWHEMKEETRGENGLSTLHAGSMGQQWGDLLFSMCKSGDKIGTRRCNIKDMHKGATICPSAESTACTDIADMCPNTQKYVEVKYWCLPTGKLIVP